MTFNAPSASLLSAVTPTNVGPSAKASNLMLDAVISMRGGSQSEEYIRSSIDFFNGLRVPAAVLGSIIMKEMYALQNSPPSAMRDWDIENRIDKSKGWRTLRYTYLLLMVLAFCLEANTIFVATQVLTSLATHTKVSTDATELSLELDSEKIGGLFTLGKRDQSMVDFLIKNFEFEYTTVRFHFVTGLMSFTIAQALRVRYALRKYSSLSMSGMCCMLCVASGALTYTNANTITYGGYLNLMKRQMKLSIDFISKRIHSGPMSAVTAILALLTLYYAIRGYFSPAFSYFELELEEEKEQKNRLDGDILKEGPSFERHHRQRHRHANKKEQKANHDDGVPLASTTLQVTIYKNNTQLKARYLLEQLTQSRDSLSHHQTMCDESPPQLISPFENAVRLKDEEHHALSPRLPLHHTAAPTTTASITTTQSTTTAANHPLLLRARAKTKRQFQNSPLLSSQQDEIVFPRFSHDELILGRVLGRGGFGTVLEVLRFDVKQSGDEQGVLGHPSASFNQKEKNVNWDQVRQVKSMDALGDLSPSTCLAQQEHVQQPHFSKEIKSKRKRSVSLGLLGRHDFFKRHPSKRENASSLVERPQGGKTCDLKENIVVVNGSSVNAGLVSDTGKQGDRPSVLPAVKHREKTFNNFSFVSWRDSMPGQEGRDAVDESDLTSCYECVEDNVILPSSSKRIDENNVELWEPDITEEEEHSISHELEKDVAQADELLPSTPIVAHQTMQQQHDTNDDSSPPRRRRIVLFSNNHNTNTSFDLNTSLRPNILQDKHFLSQHVTTSKNQSRYVVKIISPHIVRGEFSKFLQAASDIATETYFLSVLHHPRILKMRAVGQGDMFTPSYFIVMDRLYDTLSEKISGEWKKRGDHLENDFLVWNRKWKKECLWMERVGVARDLAGALGYLHDMCVIYRDLKPENIGFDSRGVAKLFDFGLAKQVRREDAQDGTYRLTANTGSLRYMSPECGNGWPYNFSTDSYSFTILLWEILALELPFNHYTAQEIVNMVRKWGERPKLKEEWSDRLKESLTAGWHSNFRQRPTLKDFETILDLELHECHAA